MEKAAALNLTHNRNLNPLPRATVIPCFPHSVISVLSVASALVCFSTLGIFPGHLFFWAGRKDASVALVSLRIAGAGRQPAKMAFSCEPLEWRIVGTEGFIVS